MARSRQAKSQSVSSSTADALVNGEMPPPSPVSSRSSPAVSRRKPSSASKATASNALASATQLKSAHAPAKPSSKQFLAAAAISFAAEALLNTASGAINPGDLAAISRRDTDWPEIAGLWTWKTVLLVIYWFSGFDAVDVASLTTLLITPTTTLYYFFYRISAVTLLSTTISSIIATSLPFYLLRPLAPPHSLSSARLRNRSIITDPLTTIATSLTATLLFAATLQASFSTFLPVFLITRFTGLRDLTVAHSLAETLPLLVLSLLPAGFASTNFLFQPSEGAPTAPATGANTVAQERNFDPVTSTFAQHVHWNLWGWYTSRQRELIGRSLVLGVLVLAETVVQIAGTVQGVEWFGALGYGFVWAGAVGVLGAMLGWVGEPSD